MHKMNVLRLFISRRTMLPKVANSDGKICQGVPAGLLFALAVLFTSSPSVPYGALVGRSRGSFPCSRPPSRAHAPPCCSRSHRGCRRFLRQLDLGFSQAFMIDQNITLNNKFFCHSSISSHEISSKMILSMLLRSNSFSAYQHKRHSR